MKIKFDIFILKIKFFFVFYIQFQEQNYKPKLLAKGTEQLQIKSDDLINIPVYCAVTYLFNPYTIFNCIGQTSTVWSNLFLAAYFYFMSKKQVVPCCFFLALEMQRNFYPLALIVPAALYLSQRETDEKESDEPTVFTWLGVLKVVTVFIVTLILTHFAAFAIAGNWKFLDSTYGFM